MIIASDHGDVRYFRMARTAFGRALYWTGVYFVDGLLIDSGPPNMRREVARLIVELGVRQCVTTHHHEDDSGDHAVLNAGGAGILIAVVTATSDATLAPGWGGRTRHAERGRPRGRVRQRHRRPARRVARRP